MGCLSSKESNTKDGDDKKDGKKKKGFFGKFKDNLKDEAKEMAKDEIKDGVKGELDQQLPDGIKIEDLDFQITSGGGEENDGAVNKIKDMLVNAFPTSKVKEDTQPEKGKDYLAVKLKGKEVYNKKKDGEPNKAILDNIKKILISQAKGIL